MAEWAGIFHTTIQEYSREEEVNIFRNRKLPALLMQGGRISHNHGGERMNWKVRYKQNNLQGMGDSPTVTHPRFNRDLSAELPWRGYVMGESVQWRERRLNKGMEAIVKIFETKAKRMLEDARDSFHTEFYIDGNASGNETKIHGIESFLGDDGTPSTTQPIADSSDTYAGMSTVLSTAGGGVWSGNWPDGSGDAQYDFWTPLLVNVSSTVAESSGGWTADTKTWPFTCGEALSFGIINTQKNRGMDDKLDLVTVTTSMYRQFQDFNRDKERINVGKDSALVKLGFTDTINWDGVDVTSEYGVPANTGYGFNTKKMELCCCTSQLIETFEPTWDETTMSWRFQMAMLLNAKFNPRNFCKFYPYS